MSRIIGGLSPSPPPILSPSPPPILSPLTPPFFQISKLERQMVAEEMCDSTQSTDDQGLDCKEVPLKNLCVDCGTSKTPLWRGGPAGPKSLCNACGIRSRKKRRALLGLTKPDKKEKDKKKSKRMMNNNNINGSKNRSRCCSSSNRYSESMFMCDTLMPHNVRIEELNEEQQAAVLLMALSHGFNSY